MRRAALLLVAFLAATVSGCGRERIVVKPVPVEVPRETRRPISPELTRPCRVAEPDAACWEDGRRVFCNGQLAQMRLDYRRALRDCDDDKTALRALDAKPAAKERP